MTADSNTVDEKDPSTHFAFGENWASYSRMVDDGRIDQAMTDLRRLVGDDIAGKSFLDIGCGSGLHALAALRLGASRIVAMDADVNSVETTRKVLAEWGNASNAQVSVTSVFDLEPGTFGLFDIVYSWGVLHHTGAMNEALERAAKCVAPGGRFAFALYRRTYLCPLWKKEKQWYTHTSAKWQRVAQSIYTGLLRGALVLSGRSFREYVRTYREKRGMDYTHDVHDWLGGYPYESITPAETDARMASLGLVREQRFVRTDGVALVPGCDEYLYRRPSAQLGAAN